MQSLHYGDPQSNHAVTTASLTDPGSHDNTMMALSLPIKPSQHPRGPQPTSRSITTLWWSMSNYCCHHKQPVGSKHMHVANTASGWSSDSPCIYPSHPMIIRLARHHSLLMVFRLSLQTSQSSWWSSDSAKRYYSYPNGKKPTVLIFHSPWWSTGISRNMTIIFLKSSIHFIIKSTRCYCNNTIYEYI